MQSFLQYRRIQSQTVRNANGDPESTPNLKPSTSPSHPNGADTSTSDQNIFVDWDGHLDPNHPHNWSLSRKIWICTIVFINVFVLDWCSSADSQTSSRIAAEFGVSRIVESVASALYVFGIAFGAIFAGPIAETVGRNPIYICSRILQVAFILGTALARNIATQMVCRFLAGLGASIILAIHGASVADLFGPEGRSYAWPLVALGSFLGTVFGPIASGWIGNTDSIPWRWADWIALILSGAAFIITFLWLPETFAPILLKWKAAQIRKVTGNERFIAKIEVQRSFLKRLGGNLKRAYLMTTREYIVILLGLWLVIIYIVIFGFLQGFSFLFEDTYDFSTGLVGTSFAAIAAGLTLNTCLAPIYAHLYRRKTEQWKQEKSANEELPPENRLIAAFPLAFTFPISLFWLGWTNYSSISPWSGLGAAALFGFSWAGIYVAIYQYILDVYGIYAGSALATITFARYGFAGGIQIISRPMWGNLGTHWTCTLLGCLAALLIPVPFALFKWGYRVRKISRFASHKSLADGAETSEEEEKV